MGEITAEQLHEWEEKHRVLYASKDGFFKGEKVLVRLYVRLGRHNKSYEIDINNETVFSSGEASTALWNYNNL